MSVYLVRMMCTDGVYRLVHVTPERIAGVGGVVGVVVEILDGELKGESGWIDVAEMLPQGCRWAPGMAELGAEA